MQSQYPDSQRRNDDSERIRGHLLGRASSGDRGDTEAEHETSSDEVTTVVGGGRDDSTDDCRKREGEVRDGHAGSVSSPTGCDALMMKLPVNEGPMCE